MAAGSGATLPVTVDWSGRVDMTFAPDIGGLARAGALVLEQGCVRDILAWVDADAVLADTDVLSRRARAIWLPVLQECVGAAV